MVRLKVFFSFFNTHFEPQLGVRVQLQIQGRSTKTRAPCKFSIGNFFLRYYEYHLNE
jgi:hypothetical protein